MFDIDNTEKVEETDQLQIHQIGNATVLLDEGLNSQSCQFLQTWLHDFETIKVKQTTCFLNINYE